MKNRFVLFSATLFFSIAARAQTDWMARIHFAGGGRISASTNFVAFTNLFCSPEAQMLKEQTLNRLSRAPYQFFEKRISNRKDDGVKQLRPLFDDTLRNEWFLEIRDTTNGSPEFALAIRLNGERAKIWSENLRMLLQNWTGIGISQDKSGNWELRKHEPPDLFQFSRAGDWIVLDCGQEKLLLRDEILSAVKNFSPSETNWLTVDLNFSRLLSWFSAAKQTRLPELSLRVFPNKGDLRLDGKMIFPQPLDLPPEAWRIPANIIHAPLSSLTAVRGARSWLKRQDGLKNFRDLLPDEIFIWALPQIPFQTYIAAPVEDATNAIVELDKILANRFAAKLNALSLGSFQLETNAEINWRGLPFVTPFVRADFEADGQFLFAGAFPNSPAAAQSLPPELFTELNRSNLVFYHWEITAEHFPGILNLSQLALVLSNHPQLDKNSLSAKWLFHIAPTLGNSVTEVTQTGTDELALTRKAPGGLTAAEFIALAHWLETTNFPLGKFHLQPLPKNHLSR